MIFEVPKNLNQKFLEPTNNIYDILFSILVKKILYCYNKATVVIAILYMLYYGCNKRLNLFQATNSHLLFTHNILKQYIEVFY